MWGRRRLWARKNFEPGNKKDLDEAMNEYLGKEQNSQDQQLRQWKDRPRIAKDEIPEKVFQSLQKQHGIEELGLTEQGDEPLDLKGELQHQAEEKTETVKSGIQKLKNEVSELRLQCEQLKKSIADSK